MSDQRDVQLRLITLIYDAALNPDAWSRFLEAFADVVNGHGLSIGHIDVESPRLSISSLARWDPDALTEYAAHFVHRDPWGRAAAERGLFVPGTVGTGEAVVRPEDLIRTEFYNDYGRRYGFVGGMVANLYRNGNSVAMLGVSTLPGYSFTADEIDLLQQLLPHLQRALQLHRRLTRLEISTNTGRGHLKNLFSKTRTRTQAQLVRAVLALPQVRPSEQPHRGGLSNNSQ